MISGINPDTRSPERQAIESQARRFLDEEQRRLYPDGMPFIELQQRVQREQQVLGSLLHREFMAQSQPFVREQVRIVSLLGTHRYILHADGSFHVLPVELPPEAQRAMALLDQHIRGIAERLGITLSPTALDDVGPIV